MREATRRQVFGIGAGAIGVMAATGSIRAGGNLQPNDAKLLELERRWLDITAQRQRLSKRIQAIRATFPAHLQPGTQRQRADHLVRRSRDGAGEAELNALRAEMDRLCAAERQREQGTEIPALEAEDDRLGGQASGLEDRMAAIEPDSAVGAAVLARMIEREAETMGGLDHALDNEPHTQMVRSLMNHAKRQAQGAV